MITEDSDLLAFGCKTVLFKLDKTGEGKRVNFEDLGNISKPCLSSFDLDMFRSMCILSGCDYVDSVPGVGLRKAHEYVRRHKTLEAVCVAMRKEGRLKIPEGYEERVRLAEMTFKHQRVWDHVNGCLALLTPMPFVEDQDTVQNDYLGPSLSHDIAYGVCSGLLDPHTHKVLFSPPFFNLFVLLSNFHQPYAPPAPSTSAVLSTAKKKKDHSQGMNAIHSYFTPQTKDKVEAKTGTIKRSDSYQKNTVEKLEAFKRKQQKEQKVDVLAPATPEKTSSAVNGQRVLLGRLLKDRVAKDCTPERLMQSPQKRSVVVESVFFDDQNDDGAEHECEVKRNLLQSFGLGFGDAEEEEDGDEEEEPDEEALDIEEEECDAFLAKLEREERGEEESGIVDEDDGAAEESNSNYHSVRINSSLKRISMRRQSTENVFESFAFRSKSESGESKVAELLASQKLARESRDSLKKSKEKGTDEEDEEKEKEVSEKEENESDVDNLKKRKSSDNDVEEDESAAAHVSTKTNVFSTFQFKKRISLYK